MGDLKLSSYNGVNKVADLKKRMIDEDVKGIPWSLELDKDWPLDEILELLIKDNGDAHADYENLENITVISNGQADFEDLGGCLTDKQKNNAGKSLLIYAPFPKHKDIKKEIQKTVNIEIARMSINPYQKIIDVWNGIYSKAIRANIREFSKGSYYAPADNYKSDFENLLWKYGYNIYSLIAQSLNMKKGVGIKYIKIKRVMLSDELFYKEYCDGRSFKKSIEDPKEIEKIVNNNDDNLYRTRSLVLGEYYAHGVNSYPDPYPEIVLYFEAMKYYARIKEVDLEDLFLSVFIHEYFHAVHHDYCMCFDSDGEKAFCNNTNAIIVESLAAAYQYYFCENILNNDDLKKDLMDTWNKYKPDVYPYSGAASIVNCTIVKEIRDIETTVKGYKGINELFNSIISPVNMYGKSTASYLLCLRCYFVLSLLFMKEAQDELVKRAVSYRRIYP